MGISDDSHEVAGLYVRAVTSFVRRAAGVEGLDRVLARAGETLDSLPDTDGWLSLDRMLNLVSAAEDVTGLADLGRLVGEEIFRIGLESGIDETIRAMGGPGEAIEMLVSMGSRMAGGWTLELLERGDDHVVVASRSPLDQAARFWCGTGLGYYPLVPTVFGLRGTGVHPRCLDRGDDACEYLIRWEGTPDTAGRSTDALNQIEKLQATAARLALAPDPESVVGLGVRLATDVNIGRRFLAVAELGSRDRRVVAHHGFGGLDEVDRTVSLLEVGAAELEATTGEMACIARLASSTGEYGWIASIHPPRSTIDGLVERPLAAFADHLSSAIESALLLEQAERDRDIAHTMVGLARDLAGAVGVNEVAVLTGEALQRSTSAVATSLWVLDQDDQVLRLAGDESEPRTLPRPTDEEVVSGLVSHTDETLISRFHPGADGVEHSSLVPLVVRGDLVGCLAIGWPGAPAPAYEIELVTGIADQAALALDVAGLMADLQRQARHDPLTGLANRALLAERAGLAMAQAARSGSNIGLLFVDLDHFKAVNDEYGHAAGDDVLREVADRLRTVVRAHDTVCRLGGDEFVVLLTECTGDNAEVAALRVLEALSTPFATAGRELSITATIGVLSAPPDGSDLDALLARADAAMYRGKQQGRAGIVVG